MTTREHIRKHKEWHKSLNELVDDFIDHVTDWILPSQISLIEFLEWSYSQTIKSDRKEKKNGNKLKAFRN
jgi:hypothetical protein